MFILLCVQYCKFHVLLTVTVQPKPTSSVHSFEGIKIKKENAYSPEKTQSGIYIDNAEDTFVQGL